MIFSLTFFQILTRVPVELMVLVGTFSPLEKLFLIDENGILIHTIDSVDINTHASDIITLFEKEKS